MSEEVTQETVETPEIETPEVETHEEQHEEQHEEAPKPKTKSAKERIDELTWQRRQAEREAAYERQQREELARRIAELEANQPKPESKTLPNGAPDPDKYPAGRYDPDYLEALTDYKVKAIINAQKQEQTAAQRKAAIAEAEAKAAENYPDYQEAATVYESHLLARVPQFVELVEESEDPAGVKYYLGKNPEELEKIANMTPNQAQRYMGRIEAALGAKPSEPPAQTTTAKPAPKPPSHIGGASSPAINKDPSKMTMDEYVAWRNKKSA